MIIGFKTPSLILPKQWMVAFAGASLVLGNAIYLHLHQKYLLTLFVFIGIFWVYNRSLLKFFFQRVEIATTLLISIFLCVWIAFTLNFNVLLFSVLFIVSALGFLYSYIKNVPRLKFWVVLFSWIFVCQGIPMMLTEQPNFNWLVVTQGISIANVALAFDLMDIETDHPRRKTIPQFLGSHYTKILIVLLSLLYGFIHCFFSNSWIADLLALTGGFLPVICLFFVKPTTRNKRLELILEFSLVIIGFSMWSE